MIQPILKFTQETKDFYASITLKNEDQMIFKVQSKNNQKFSYGNSFTIDNTPEPILYIINSGLIENLKDFYIALLSIKNSFVFNEELNTLEVSLTFCHKKSVMEIPVYKDFYFQGEGNSKPVQPANIGQVPEQLNEVENQLKKNNGEIYYAKFSDQQGHYEGQMLNGLKHGQGKFFFKNGDLYTGEYCEGYRHGYGEFLYQDGQKYEGNFISNHMYGKGKYYMKNGSTCESFFKLSLANGPGIQTTPQGDVIYGSYKDGIIQGNQVTFYPNGDIAEQPDDSFTKYYFQNGEIFQGYYKNGLKMGFGTIFWADNVKEEGNFLNGQKHGEFKMIYANGQVEKSFWYKDVVCSEEEFKLQTTTESAGPAPAAIQEVPQDEDDDKEQNAHPK